MVHQADGQLVGDAVAVGIQAVVAGDRRRLDGVEGAVQDHARGRRDPLAVDGRVAEVGVIRLDPHLGVERADQELADRDRAALREERTHAQIGVHADDARRHERAVRVGRDRSVADPLRRQRPRLRRAGRLGGRQRLGADGPQIGRDLVAQHLLQAEPEQVRRVAAVRTREDVAAEPGRAARAAVAAGARIDDTGADRRVDRDVAARSRPLKPCVGRNFRWNSCRPRRTERNGSRWMMKMDESGVLVVAAPGAYLTSNVLVNAVADGDSRRSSRACHASARCAVSANPTVIAPATTAIPYTRSFMGALSSWLPRCPHKSSGADRTGSLFVKSSIRRVRFFRAATIRAHAQIVCAIVVECPNLFCK